MSGKTTKLSPYEQAYAAALRDGCTPELAETIARIHHAKVAKKIVETNVHEWQVKRQKARDYQKFHHAFNTIPL